MVSRINLLHAESQITRKVKPFGLVSLAWDKVLEVTVGFNSSTATVTSRLLRLLSIPWCRTSSSLRYHCSHLCLEIWKKSFMCSDRDCIPSMMALLYWRMGKAILCKRPLHLSTLEGELSLSRSNRWFSATECSTNQPSCSETMNSQLTLE